MRTRRREWASLTGSEEEAVVRIRSTSLAANNTVVVKVAVAAKSSRRDNIFFKNVC